MAWARLGPIPPLCLFATLFTLVVMLGNWMSLGEEARADLYDMKWWAWVGGLLLICLAGGVVGGMCFLLATLLG